VNLSGRSDIRETFVIGGAEIYKKALSPEFLPHCKLVLQTRINKDFEADAFMEPFEDTFSPIFVSETYS
jgi:dihydrofolate reductase